MAQISKPAIKPKAYIQFAVVTLVMTATLAILAQDQYETKTGSPPAAFASPSARPSPASTRAVPAYGESNLRVGDSLEVGNAGAGFDDSPPVIHPGSGGRSIPAGIVASDVPAAGSENAGFTRQYLNSLTEEELAELLRQLQAAGVEDNETRRRAMMVIETASRRRSGRATTSD